MNRYAITLGLARDSQDEKERWTNSVDQKDLVKVLILYRSGTLINNIVKAVPGFSMKDVLNAVYFHAGGPCPSCGGHGVGAIVNVPYVSLGRTQIVDCHTCKGKGRWSN